MYCMGSLPPNAHVADVQRNPFIRCQQCGLELDRVNCQHNISVSGQQMSLSLFAQICNFLLNRSRQLKKLFLRLRPTILTPTTKKSLSCGQPFSSYTVTIEKWPYVVNTPVFPVFRTGNGFFPNSGSTQTTPIWKHITMPIFSPIAQSTIEIRRYKAKNPFALYV